MGTIIVVPSEANLDHGHLLLLLVWALVKMDHSGSAPCFAIIVLEDIAGVTNFELLTPLLVFGLLAEGPDAD